jgi:hypothetical protein
VRARLVGLLVAAAMALGACGLLLPESVSGPGFQGGGSCSELPGGACQEQLELIGRRHPGATNIDLACGLAVCDRKGGAGTAVVTLADGSRVNDTFAYTGDAAPAPVPSCTGIAIDICGSLAATTMDDVPPSRSVRAIAIRCTVASCTPQRGDTEVRVRFADGSEFVTSSGWEGGPP